MEKKYLSRSVDCFKEPMTFDKTIKIGPKNKKEGRFLQTGVLRNPNYRDSNKFSETPKKILNIGFVSIWFERGQSYVTKALRDIVAKEHNAFVLARTGMVYGQTKLEKNLYWNVPNLTTYSEYEIPPDILISWIRKNELDAVIFNEEYDWELVRTVKYMGAKALTYLDYYKEDWKHNMRLYDKVLCSTLRTYHMAKDFCNAHYIGWAVDTELFRPTDHKDKEFTFFHNAGWLGMNFRKMTPAVVLAFDAISKYLQDVTLFIHTQVELDKLPPVIIRLIRDNPRITYHIETVPAPGLYHKGHILVFASKLEGLGLPLPEGLACGLPAIATNAPPMNEFVRDGYNGLLVDVAHCVERKDNIIFPETLVSVNDLAVKMAQFATDPARVVELGKNARRYVEENLSLQHFEEKVLSSLNELI